MSVLDLSALEVELRRNILYFVYVFVSVLDLSDLEVELMRNILYFVYVFVSVYATFIFVFTKL